MDHRPVHRALWNLRTCTPFLWIQYRRRSTWQLIPRNLQTWLADPKHGPVVTEAMLQMTKLDIATLQQALNGPQAR